MSAVTAWLIDLWAVIRDALGPSRYTIGSLAALVAALAAILLGRELSPADKIALTVLVGLVFLILALANYAIGLRRAGVPSIELAYRSGERPFETFLTHAKIPIRPDKIIQAPATFFSIRIKNTSATQPLRSVHVELIDVERHDGSKFISHGFGSPLHLQWEKRDGEGDGWSPRDLPPSATRYVNVVSVDEPTNRVWIKARHQWQDNEGLFREPGVFRLTVAVLPLEGAGKSIRLGMKWNGDWRATAMWEIDEERPDSPLAPGAEVASGEPLAAKATA